MIARAARGLMVLILGCFAEIGIGFPNPDITPLINWPMITSHDAATGYIKFKDPVTRWAITQSTGFAGQLDCGSRSFDVRPHYANGKLLMHHGEVIVDHELRSAMQDVIDWTSKNQGEFVMPYVTDCDGDGCENATKSMLNDLNITYIDDCSKLTSLNVSQAMNISRHPSGGSILVIFGCVDEQYYPSVECYIEEKLTTYICYKEGKNSLPFERMWSTLKTSTMNPPSSHGGRLWMAQAHWQYSAESVSIGLLHDSSILLDESQSKMNLLLVSNITNHDFPYLNMLEVDNVCDHGNDILAALQNSTMKL